MFNVKKAFVVRDGAVCFTFYGNAGAAHRLMGYAVSNSA